jgi:tetratricopeptide (TPR) repeat protein
MLLKSKGERKTAMAVYEEVLAAQETHLGRGDIDVAATINNMGVLLRGEDLFHEMLPLYERALRIRERLWKKTRKKDSQRKANAYKLAESHANMGALLLDLGRPRHAGPHLDRALSIVGGEFGQNHERNAGTLVMRGAALRALGIYPDTMTSVENALSIYGAVTAHVPPEAAQTLANLGSILAELAENDGVYEWQRPQLREMAGKWLQLALTASERGYGEDHPMTGGLNGALGSVRDAQGATQDARAHRVRAEACRRINLGGTDARAADAINGAGRSLMGWGLYDEAQAYFQRTLEIRENVLGERSFGTSTSHFNLGILLQLRGRDEQARHDLKRALAIRRDVCGESHPATEMVRENLRILDS